MQLLFYRYFVEGAALGKAGTIGAVDPEQLPVGRLAGRGQGMVAVHLPAIRAEGEGTGGAWASVP